MRLIFNYYSSTHGWYSRPVWWSLSIFWIWYPVLPAQYRYPIMIVQLCDQIWPAMWSNGPVMWPVMWSTMAVMWPVMWSTMTSHVTSHVINYDQSCDKSCDQMWPLMWSELRFSICIVWSTSHERTLKHVPSEHGLPFGRGLNPLAGLHVVPSIQHRRHSLFSSVQLVM